MTTDQPPPRGEIPELGRFEKGLLGAVVLGAVGGAGVGLYSSFDSVSAAAARWGFDPSWILPVALDVSIPVFSLANLLLIRLDMPLGWVRLVPWGLTAVTVYMNVESAGDSFASQIGHGALPGLWVVLSEIVAHVYRTKIGAVTGRRMEGVRRSRWLLAPGSTAALWRRMKLWEIRSYRTALELERTRILARVELREEFGWNWRWKGKARRQRALLRLGELSPEAVTGSAVGGELAAETGGSPAPELAAGTGAEKATGTELAAAATGAKSAPALWEKRQDELATTRGTGDKRPLTSGFAVGADKKRPLTIVIGDAPEDAADPGFIDLLGIGDELAAVGSGGNSGAGASSEEAGDNWAEAVDSSEEAVAKSGGAGDRNEDEAGDSSAANNGTGDSSRTGDSGTGDSSEAPRTGGKRRKRRSTEEWVELAEPIFDAEMRRRKRQPSGPEFAAAIELAGYGAVSDSTAKNIRTAILDHRAKALTAAR